MVMTKITWVVLLSLVFEGCVSASPSLPASTKPHSVLICFPAVYHGGVVTVCMDKQQVDKQIENSPQNGREQTRIDTH